MPDAAITVRGLVKRFGDVTALKGIDFDVPRASILGLLGPNGAGKTTAVRILTTILQPDGGEAHIMGLDVTRQPRAVRSILGLAGQYAAVDGNLTGRENLQMVGQLTHQPRAQIAARSQELLDRFGLADAADRPSRTYSGGMRRRLDLAAALVHRPPVLFLDEPTTGLDPKGRNDLWAVISELVADGTTLLLTTQYLEEADRLADNIVVIDGGQVIAEGSSAELKSQIGATVVEIRTPDADAARQVATHVDRVGATQLIDDGRTVAVNVDNGGKSLLEIVRLLDEASFEPEGVIVREPTLDDVFLRLTGHTTSADGDAQAAAAAPTRGGVR
jgi:daunorubicin resistance ABC transporter ATP-binding subunit